MKLTGATGIGITGLMGSAGAKPDKKNGKGALEDSPSWVGVASYGGEGTTFPDFPTNGPIVGGIMPPEITVFDTTAASITPNGNTIHYQLQFGADTKPYILNEHESGTYVSRGSVINFDLEEGSDQLNLSAGKYRAVVRDEVHLYDSTDYFDWSVTRTETYSRNKGMNYVASAIIIVWDEDGPENGAVNDYRNQFDPNLPAVLPTADGPDISEVLETANQFIEEGTLNPGGQ